MKVLTLYAFRLKTGSDQKDEVSFSCNYLSTFDTFVPELIKENVKVHVMGYENVLPEHTQDAKTCTEQTKQYWNGIEFCFEFGSRAEIVTAVQEIAEEVAKGEIHAANR